MTNCRFCGTPVPDERVAAGYTNCTDKPCVRRNLAEQRRDWAIILVPKQGFTYAKRDDVQTIGSGRSSGR